METEIVTSLINSVFASFSARASGWLKHQRANMVLDVGDCSDLSVLYIRGG